MPSKYNSTPWWLGALVLPLPGCVQVCSPLFPAPLAPMIVDRGCPEAMAAMQGPIVRSVPMPLETPPPLAPSHRERIPTAAPGVSPSPPEDPTVPPIEVDVPALTPGEPMPPRGAQPPPPPPAGEIRSSATWPPGALRVRVLETSGWRAVR